MQKKYIANEFCSNIVFLNCASLYLETQTKAGDGSDQIVPALLNAGCERGGARAREAVGKHQLTNEEDTLGNAD